MPQGNAQGWSDHGNNDGEHCMEGVQFAQSLQTTPGKYHNLHIVTVVPPTTSLLFCSPIITRMSSLCSHLICVLDLYPHIISQAYNCPCFISWLCYLLDL